MILSKDQFPITIQAYEITDNKEFFIAEQVVSNQSEVDAFVSRYAGKVIKARALNAAETTTTTTTTTTRRKSNAGTIFLVILILLVILVAIGYYTGWIQRTFGLSM